MASLPSTPQPLKFSHGLNAHWQTIYPHLMRNFRSLYHSNDFKRSEIESSDGDLNTYLNWTATNPPLSPKKIVILSHGLEGAANSHYNIETASVLVQQGYDVWAWNMRGCGPKMNPGPLLYNSGFTSDLKDLVEKAKQENYDQIFLIGFSVGGNITLKALGEGLNGISAAIAFSSPLVLKDVSSHLSKSFDGFYMKRFLKTLKEKIRRKETQYPGSFDLHKLDSCKDFYSFDDSFTAPMHGYLSADDYYEKSSSIHLIKNIHTPVKIISATNDPFLTSSCFPDPQAYPHLSFQYPNRGGHCGFGSAKDSMAALALDFFGQMTNLEQ